MRQLLQQHLGGPCWHRSAQTAAVGTLILEVVRLPAPRLRSQRDAPQPPTAPLPSDTFSGEAAALELTAMIGRAVQTEGKEQLLRDTASPLPSTQRYSQGDVVNLQQRVPQGGSQGVPRGSDAATEEQQNPSTPTSVIVAACVALSARVAPSEVKSAEGSNLDVA